jgi:hypothetical protein
MRVPMEKVKSSLIESVGYDSGKKQLHVVFKKTRGRKYIYEGVDPEFYDSFMDAESIGSFFMHKIKGQFEYTVDGADG